MPKINPSAKLELGGIYIHDEGVDAMQSTISAALVGHTDYGSDNLADVCDVVIDTSLPQEERMKSYIRQIKNPYLFRCDDVTVRISFADADTSLEERIKQLMIAPCTY